MNLERDVESGLEEFPAKACGRAERERQKSLNGLPDRRVDQHFHVSSPANVSAVPFPNKGENNEELVEREGKNWKHKVGEGERAPCGKESGGKRNGISSLFVVVAASAGVVQVNRQSNNAFTNTSENGPDRNQQAIPARLEDPPHDRHFLIPAPGNDSPAEGTCEPRNGDAQFTEDGASW